MGRNGAGPSHATLPPLMLAGAATHEDTTLMDHDLLTTVLTLSRRMAQTRQLEPLLDYAMREAIRLTGAEQGYLVLLNADGSLDFHVKLDDAGHEIRWEDSKFSQGILRQVIDTNEPELQANALESALSAFDSVMAYQLRSVMCVPLSAQGAVLGAIFLENSSQRGLFSSDDLAALSLFANQAATAIENAMLNDELEARVQARTAELEAANQRLEQSWLGVVENNRLRTELLSNVVHDIRSPLSLVLNVLVTLRDEMFGPVNEEQRHWVGQAFAALEHVIQLTDDMFDLTKLEVGQLALHPEPTDMTEFLQTTHQVGEGFPWPEGVAYQLDLPETLPTLTIDPTRIRQVILNLLSNALKFTEQGSVTLRARLHDDGLCISVADTGIGIPPEDLAAVFDRFHQVDSNLTRRKKGTGLGLAICHELVNMHGGEIWVESDPGQGATFSFTLPV